MITQIDRVNLESGIYCAIHRDSGMCYVGSSVNMGRRRRTHLRDAKNGSLNYFHRALREFGEWNFDFEVLEYCEKSQLVDRETFWIRFLNSASVEGFNTDANPSSCYDYGHAYSEATRQRLREAVLGKPRPQWVKDKISATLKGRKKTPEHIEKVRLANIGKKVSPESIAKRVAKVKGRKQTPEHIAKVVATRLGKPLSDAHKASLSKAQKGRKLSEEHKRKVSIGLTGKKKSPETLEKWKKSMEQVYARRGLAKYKHLLE